MIFSAERKTLAACCGVHAIHDGLSHIMYVLLPVLAGSFGLSYTEVGLVRGAHRAAMAMFQLPATPRFLGWSRTVHVGLNPDHSRRAPFLPLLMI